MVSRTWPASWRHHFGLIFLCVEIYGDILQLPEISVSLDGTAEIPCNHSVSGYNGLFWYKHSPDTAPHSIISTYLEIEKKGRFTMKVDKPNLSTKLSISQVEMNDTAVYYCAVRDTVVGKARGPEQKPTGGVA
ncbi:UNVERIFIED_CONTAM: hypothetical protein K2H54_045043 [Gekko kuhli]